MKNKLIFFASFLGQLAFAQTDQPAIYERYPDKQVFYTGGNVQFFKELHQVFIESDLKPCENKEEFYDIKFVIYSDSTIKFIKPEDIAAVEKSKCTYDLIKSSFKYLKNWMPATIDNKKVNAIADVFIYPDDLFDNYKEGYDIENFMVEPSYAEGINVFRSRFAQKINMNGFGIKNEGSLIIRFVVNENGIIEDIKLDPPSGNKEFDNMVINAIKNVKGKWIPGTIKGKPVKSRFRFPITVNNN